MSLNNFFANCQQGKSVLQRGHVGTKRQLDVNDCTLNPDPQVQRSRQVACSNNSSREQLLRESLKNTGEITFVSMCTPAMRWGSRQWHFTGFLSQAAQGEKPGGVNTSENQILIATHYVSPAIRRAASRQHEGCNLLNNHGKLCSSPDGPGVLTPLLDHIPVAGQVWCLSAPQTLLLQTRGTTAVN